MKLSRKKILIISIVALNVFNGWVLYRWWRTRATRDAPKTTEMNAKIDTLVAEKKAERQKPVIDSVQQQAYLPILGKSDKLSARDFAKLQAYREKQRKIAENYPGELYFNGDTSRKVVALTFDDGPDRRVTPQVLKILAKYKVPASFFLVGSYVKKYPEVVKQVLEAGHLVLNHSATHQSYLKKSKDWLKQDLLSTEEAIYKVIGKRPAMFRPPYGDIDAQMIEVIKDNDYKHIIWSYDTLDWTGASVDTIAQGLIQQVRPGEIVLMHSRSGVENTVKALPTIIQKLRAQGYQLVKLDEMLGVQAYK